MKLREKENQLSSWYDRGTLNSAIIFWNCHNVLERYDFGTRRHIEVRFNLSLVEGPKMIVGDSHYSSKLYTPKI